MHSLIQWDRSLFKLVNFKWHNDFFDFLMLWLRNANVWVPLYFFLLLFALFNFKKNVWWWIAFAAITASICDYISSNIIKEYVARVRPCNDPAFADWIRVLVKYRPKSGSFTSSHATNHFGLAMFLYLTLKDQLGKWPFLFFLWAFCICYAQVYVGVHFPLDVAAGAVIGIIIGYLTGSFYRKKFGLA